MLPKILLGALLVIAFACGVFFRGLQSPLFTPSLLSILLMSGILLLPGLRRGWIFPAGGMVCCLLLFWAWLGVSLLWSEAVFISIVFFLSIGALPLLFFSVIQHEKSGVIIDCLWRSLAMAGAVLALWAVVQFLFLTDLAGGRIHHPMLNANNLAVVVSLVLFLFLGLFCHAEKTGRVIYGALIILCLIAVMATQSRGGGLGLVMGGIVFITLCRLIIQKDKKAFLVLGLAILFTIGAMLSHHYIQGAGDVRLIGLGEGGAGSIHERFLLWGSALSMLGDRFFTGAGLGTFYLLYPPYRHLDDTSDGYFLHLDPLQFGVETGFAATILFYGFALAVLLRFIRALKGMGRDDPRRFMLVIPFCGLLALGINAHVNFDLYMLPPLLCGAVFLMRFYKASDVPAARRVRIAPKGRLYFAVMIPFLVVFCLAAPFWVAKAGIGVHLVNQGMQALQRNDMQAAKDYRDLALRHAPDSYSRGYYLDALFQEKILQDNFITLTAAQRSLYHDGAMAALDRALYYNPRYIQALGHKALLYYIAYPRLDPDGFGKAITVLEQAIAIDPVNSDIRISLAELYAMRGQDQRALAVLEEGQDYRILQHYAPAGYLVLWENLRRRNGDHEGAEDVRKTVHQREVARRARQQQQSALDQYLAGRLKDLLHR